MKITDMNGDLAQSAAAQLRPWVRQHPKLNQKGFWSCVRCKPWHDKKLGKNRGAGSFEASEGRSQTRIYGTVGSNKTTIVYEDNRHEWGLGAVGSNVSTVVCDHFGHEWGLGAVGSALVS